MRCVAAASNYFTLCIYLPNYLPWQLGVVFWILDTFRGMSYQITAQQVQLIRQGKTGMWINIQFFYFQNQLKSVMDKINLLIMTKVIYYRVKNIKLRCSSLFVFWFHLNFLLLKCVIRNSKGQKFHNDFSYSISYHIGL